MVPEPDVVRQVGHHEEVEAQVQEQALVCPVSVAAPVQEVAQRWLANADNLLVQELNCHP